MPLNMDAGDRCRDKAKQTGKVFASDMDGQGKTRSILFRDLGLIDYKEAWDLQQESLDSVVRQKLDTSETTAENQIPGGQVVYFCEHPHVYTLGKSGRNQNLLIPDAFLEKINAGMLPMRWENRVKRFVRNDDGDRGFIRSGG